MEKDLDLGIDISKILNHDDYRAVWNRLSRIEIKMVEKHEECSHDVGDCFYYENPYKKPGGVCNALLHVLDLYVWRVAFGYPSWNNEDRRVFRLHCPDPKGTVWEMRKVGKQD